jgi:hypothetical protein
MVGAPTTAAAEFSPPKFRGAAAAAAVVVVKVGATGSHASGCSSPPLLTAAVVAVKFGADAADGGGRRPGTRGRAAPGAPTAPTDGGAAAGGNVGVGGMRMETLGRDATGTLRGAAWAVSDR